MPKIEPPVEADELAETATVPPPEPVPAAGDRLEPSYPSWRTLARWALVGLALYGVGWLLWNARPALIPFIIGLVLAYLLSPIVNRLDRKMPRWLAILIVYAGGIVLLIAAINYVVPPVANQIQQLIDSFPSVDQLQDMWQSLLQQYQSQVPPAIKVPLEQGVRDGLQTLQGNIATYVQSLGGFIFNQIL